MNTPDGKAGAAPAAASAKQDNTSRDRAALANWRFSENNGFVVKDYTGIAENAEPVILVLKSGDIFDYLADAVANKRKIAIFAIGPCVIDLS